MHKGGKAIFYEQVEPLTRRLQYRIYEGEGCPIPENYGYHQSLIFARDEPFSWDTDDRERQAFPETFTEATATPKSAWATTCSCGFQFTKEAYRQLFQDLLFRNTTTGEQLSKRDIPPNSLYFDPFLGIYYGGTGQLGPGPDGQYLIAICPNGRHWCIDSRASNCTMPEDNNHKCWVRHGDPRLGNVHVDKNGVTCQAGGGSIQAGDYHGFLHHGSFTDNG